MSQLPGLSKFFQTKKSESETKDELQSYNDNKNLISSLPCKNNLYCYNGFCFIEQALRGILSIQKHFKPFPTDIFLNTFPKSGTTWLKSLALTIANRHSLSSDNHPFLTTHPQNSIPHLKGAFSSPQVPDFSVLSHPRLFASHMPYSLLPKSVMDCKIIYVSRDPKDTFVSFWHFANKIRGLEMPLNSFDNAFKDFCEGQCVYGPIWDHQMEYMRESLKRPEMVLFLEYEEMKAKPEENVRKIAEFMGKGFAEEEDGLVEEIVKLCSIESLKQLEVSKAGVYADVYGWSIDNSAYFRKGKVGDWKEHLSPEMAEMVNKITEQKLAQYGLT